MIKQFLDLSLSDILIYFDMIMKISHNKYGQFCQHALVQCEQSQLIWILPDTSSKYIWHLSMTKLVFHDIITFFGWKWQLSFMKWQSLWQVKIKESRTKQFIYKLTKPGFSIMECLEEANMRHISSSVNKLDYFKPDIFNHLKF